MVRFRDLRRFRLGRWRARRLSRRRCVGAASLPVSGAEQQRRSKPLLRFFIVTFFRSRSKRQTGKKSNVAPTRLP